MSGQRFLQRFGAFLVAGLLHLGALASTLGVVAEADLPREAQQTLRLIRQGGPFPYAKDGVVFGNYEGLLPKQKRGYYREFTVRTPYARNRGARRIVAAGQPAKTFYYTADHYASFKRIKEQKVGDESPGYRRQPTSGYQQHDMRNK